ncbi:hypothetical protein [Streptomyces katrae]|uniref:hypothetical protein n=1 Tax=Streptomyces katrae TaxID=68223 RepID=UPI0004BF4DD8
MRAYATKAAPAGLSLYLAGLAQTALGAVVVLGFALAGAGPYQQLLPWVNMPGMIGLMALMLLAAIAVPVCFRRTAHTEGPWRNVDAPVAAAVLLAVAIVVVVSKAGLFTMASAVDTVLVALVPAVFLAGPGLARRVESRSPEIHARFAAEPTEASEGGEPCPLPTPSSPEPASASSTPAAPGPAG